MTPKQETPTPQQEMKALRSAFTRRAKKVTSNLWRYVREHKNSLDSEIHSNHIESGLLTVYDEVETLAYRAVENRGIAEKDLRTLQRESRRKEKAAKEKISELEKAAADSEEELIKRAARIESLEIKIQIQDRKKPAGRPRITPKPDDKQGEAVGGMVVADSPSVKELKTFKEKAKKLASVATVEETPKGGKDDEEGFVHDNGILEYDRDGKLC